MAYQVLARKWRPQRFDEVVGQRGVTQTLRNAITSGRIAQAFVFAGPRGVGKTTTARILARALNCERGPTADPCGACEACREIAEGRDMDVLEIDAATHTGVDNVREVIIGGLGILPVRDRYKVFVIDEVHQLSSSSFNALLKSIEEPPPHVVFMMATTELAKIPDTILSRSQVFEFKTIGTMAIADQLRRIAAAEAIEIDEGALLQIARSAEGSMRDAQSALDQVIAFAGDRIVEADVVTVLGLVGRDLLFDIVQAVADEDAPALLDLAGRAVEAGYDLRLLCRELSRLVRDLLVLLVDPSRARDPEIAPDADRDRLLALAARFSREDLLRAFDVLAKAEVDIRSAAQPRFHLEMALLRWLQLPKLTPLVELIAQFREGAPAAAGTAAVRARSAPAEAARPPATPAVSMPRASAPPATASRAAKPPSAPRSAAPPAPAPPPGEEPPAAAAVAPRPARTDDDVKTEILGEIAKAKRFFHGAVIAQANRITFDGNRLVFAFLPLHRTLRNQLDQSRGWMEPLAERIAGRPVRIESLELAPEPIAEDGGEEQAAVAPDLRSEALSNAGVQAMLDVFAAEIREVEEMEKP